MKRTTPKSKPTKGAKSWTVSEAAVAYAKPVEVSVSTAQEQLQALLERAALGENIIVTSDGKPMAMIVRYRPVITGQPARSMAALRRSMPMSPDSTPLIRKMRDRGY